MKFFVIVLYFITSTDQWLHYIHYQGYCKNRLLKLQTKLQLSSSVTSKLRNYSLSRFDFGLIRKPRASSFILASKNLRSVRPSHPAGGSAPYNPRATVGSSPPEMS